MYVIITFMRRRSEEYLPEFTERAEVAYQRLSASDQARIDAVLQDIQNVGLRSRSVRRIHAPHKIYLARAGAHLRVIFQYEDGVFTILDITTQDKIGKLARLYNWNEGV